MVKIGVIGAGVIGLSSALRVLERFPNADVTVIAAQLSPDTATNVSGGFWEPHLLGETPESDIRFQERGGRLLQRRLSSLHELSSDAYDVIINCSGTGARELLGDNKVQAVRGQVMRVYAPWMKMHFSFEFADGTEGYVLPGL